MQLPYVRYQKQNTQCYRGYYQTYGQGVLLPSLGTVGCITSRRAAVQTSLPPVNHADAQGKMRVQFSA